MSKKTIPFALVGVACLASTLSLVAMEEEDSVASIQGLPGKLVSAMLGENISDSSDQIETDSVNAELFTRTFVVRPNFIENLHEMAKNNGKTGEPLDDTRKYPPYILFGRLGITFPEGSAATFIASTSTLLVRNTKSNLDWIEHIINDMDFSKSENSGKMNGIPLSYEEKEIEETIHKLKNIMIPKVAFENETIEGILKFFKESSAGLDQSGKETGIDFILDSSTGLKPEQVAVTKLKMSNITLLEVIRFFSQKQGIVYRVSMKNTVVFLSRAKAETELSKRTYDIPVGFGQKLRVAAGVDGSAKREEAVESLFKQMGIAFDNGAYAKLIDGGRKMEVYNTTANIHMVESTLYNIGESGTD